jgi:hypothetical protein
MNVVREYEGGRAVSDTCLVDNRYRPGARPTPCNYRIEMVKLKVGSQLLDQCAADVLGAPGVPTYRDRIEWCLLKGYRSYIKEPMATEAHGTFTDNFCVFHGFRGYLSGFGLN